MRLLLTLTAFFLLNYSNAQTLVFKNTEFLKAVLKKHPEADLNHDNKIQQDEADKMKVLDLTYQNLKDVEDVNKFKNIEKLVLSLNQIQKIKLDNFQYLAQFYCAKNNLTELEISNMPMLTDFACGGNQLTHVSIINCPNITSLNVMDNKITAIDLRSFKKLTVFTGSENKLQNLDLSNNPELIQISIHHNQIKSIDITKNQKIQMWILYIDEGVKIIATAEQMKKTKPEEPLYEPLD